MGSAQSRTLGQASTTTSRNNQPSQPSSNLSPSSAADTSLPTSRSYTHTAQPPSRRRPRPADSVSTQSSAVSASGSPSPSSTPHPNAHESSRPLSTGQAVSPFIDESSSRINGKGKEREVIPAMNGEDTVKSAPGMSRSKSSLMSIFKGAKQKGGREKKRRRLDDEVGSAETTRMDTSQELEGAGDVDGTADDGGVTHTSTDITKGPADASISYASSALPPASKSQPSTQAFAPIEPAVVTASNGELPVKASDAEIEEDVDMDAAEGAALASRDVDGGNLVEETAGAEPVSRAPIELGPPIAVGTTSYPIPHEERGGADSATSMQDTATKLVSGELETGNTATTDATTEDRSRALSPAIIPLTTSDPLISDRLSALSAIRDVLGDDVLRSLPAVRTARASLDLERRVSRTSGEATVVQAEAEEVASVLPAGVEIPADTRSLLEELDEKHALQADRDDAAEAAAAVMAVDDDLPPPPPASLSTETSYEPFSAPLSSAGLPTPSTLLTPASPTIDHAPLQRPSLSTLGAAIGSERTASRHSSNLSLSSRNREREGQLGRVASRLSGWLGLNGAEGSGAGSTGSTSGNDTAWSSRPSMSRARSAEDFIDPGLRASTRISPLTSPVSEDPPTLSDTDEPSRARIRPGATLIIQGFVQTSMPSRALARNQSDRARPNDLLDGERHTAAPAEEPSAADGAGHAAGATSQTHTRSTLRRRQSAGESGARPRRDGLFGRNRATSPLPPPPAFAQQAQMLGGLLSVATAATAASLLTPPGQASPLARSNERAAATARSTLGNIRDRLRQGASSNRSNVSDTMDESLREYMRHAMDPNRAWSDDSQDTPQGGYTAGPDGPVPATENTGPSPAARSRLRTLLPNTDSDAFETFLDNMQFDLSRQLREYVGEIMPGTPLDAASPAPTVTAAAGTNDVAEPMDVDPASIALPADDDEMEVDEALDTESTSAPAAEPDDLGHVRPGTPYPASMIHGREDAAGEPSGSSHTAAGDDSARSTTDTGVDPPPRRFNFFRMFQFPSREQEPANGQPVTPTNPMQNLVPVLIIGVRSLNRDISTMTSGDAANSPFMFGDEEDEAEAAGTGTHGIAEPSPLLDTSSGHSAVAPESATDAEVTTTPLAPAEQGADSQTRPGGWGSRALRALGRHRRNDESERRARSSLFSGSSTTPPSSPPSEEDNGDPSVRNYVLWVFGGHYPPNHPILTIPQLFTGIGDLTHDDLWALAEAMGQVKPPTATREDIKKSGLEEIKGDKIGLAVQDGKVLENCLERCLICLGDYEAEEDCRIMSCKHAFHSPCIDHWLEVGRNSCPACRQAGVETTSSPPGTQATPTAESAVPTPTSS